VVDPGDGAVKIPLLASASGVSVAGSMAPPTTVRRCRHAPIQRRRIRDGGGSISIAPKYFALALANPIKNHYMPPIGLRPNDLASARFASD
jgi:hypothetical protein